jgi:hypothetical protein
MGRLEVYLVDILEYMRSTFKEIVKSSIQEVETKQQRELDRAKSFISMPINRFNEICYCLNCNFKNFNQKWRSIKTGFRSSIKIFCYLIKFNFGRFIRRSNGQYYGLIKSETHSSDVIDKLIQEKESRADDFFWQSQMKHIRIHKTIITFRY